jgi:putative ABC transport system ATP-binding protein
MALIRLENLSKIYGLGDATTIALDDISLGVDRGEFIAVMGPSGSGKSTLLNIIGLLDRPSQGKYTLDGRNVSRIRSRSRAKVRRDKIGFVFQNFNLLPRMTVIENVALPLAYRGMTNLRRMYRASEILDRLGLKSREYYYPTQLSGGQMQKVAIARALVNRPNLIIADEPTGNLDSASSKVVMDLLKEIHQNDNTIIMVTHNPDLTEYASRIVYMRDGRIHQDKDLKGHEKADVKELHNAPSIEEEQVILAKKSKSKKSKKAKTKKKAKK